MDHLPDELLCSIFKYTIENVNQLVLLQSVCKKFQRLSNNSYLWYYAFKKLYPKWANNIQFAHDKQPLIDWKQFMLRIYKQKSFISSPKYNLSNIISKENNATRIPSPTYKIEEPIISDIDPVTNTGIIAVSKSGFPTRHKILFYSYPSYRLLRKFELQFKITTDVNWSCQIVGMQTLQINNEKVRLFAISLNQPREEQEGEQEGEQRQTFWNTLIIYRLFDDGSTTCLANLNAYILGRGTWFFSNEDQQYNKWLQMISPNENYESKAFLMVFGLGPHQFEGLVQVMSFDVTKDDLLLDPSRTVYEWNGQDFFISLIDPDKLEEEHLSSNDAHTVTMFYLESRVSCMVHFSHIKELEHLICTGNFHGDDISIYDWRFGIKVGVLKQLRNSSNNAPRNNINTPLQQPWGLESTFAITPPPSYKITTDEKYGPRLIVVGDCQDKFEIKVWDISCLLNVHWNPFNHDNSIQQQEDIDNEEVFMFYENWWNNRTSTLSQLALDIYNGDIEKLPYTITSDIGVKNLHLLEAQVKYVAYINLNTWLYLLREDGILSIMDIESGEILSTVNTGGIAEDVNVIGNNEIIVTRKLELKRSVLPM